MQINQILIEEIFDQDLFYYFQIFLLIKQKQYQDHLHVNPEKFKIIIIFFSSSFEISLQDDNFHMEDICM
jgi:hypothetical protein